MIPSILNVAVSENPDNTNHPSPTNLITQNSEENKTDNTYQPHHTEIHLTPKQTDKPKHTESGNSEEDMYNSLSGTNKNLDPFLNTKSIPNPLKLNSESPAPQQQRKRTKALKQLK
ncbi:unnamed protein product [Nezara viridula]|uniref:Uncharacterized protein n=1 Tax=Nezara viridula TaxID=85310 RepID=A0A9P0E4W3_NEZVI|nr:unnamed protein product [Nezara viridula]